MELGLAVWENKRRIHAAEEVLRDIGKMGKAIYERTLSRQSLCDEAKGFIFQLSMIPKPSMNVYI